MIKFTNWPLYPRGKKIRYSLNVRLGEPQRRPGRLGLREISIASTGIRTQDRPDSSPVSIATALMENDNVGKFNFLATEFYI